MCPPFIQQFLSNVTEPRSYGYTILVGVLKKLFEFVLTHIFGIFNLVPIYIQVDISLTHKNIVHLVLTPIVVEISRVVDPRQEMKALQWDLKLKYVRSRM